MNFLNGAFRVGRLFEIDIHVHFLFVLWIVFRLFTAAQGGINWVDELLFLVLLFGIVLLHEFGHCFGARSVGGDAANILMWPLGGLAYAHAPMRPWPQFVTVAAGPAVNVVLCLLSAAVILAISGGRILPPINPLGGQFTVIGAGPLSVPDWITYIFIFYRVNLFLLAFNLLPIYPLDGGQLFHAIIWPFVGLQRATIIAAQVGLVGCAILGLLALTGTGGILFFIAIFGGFTCWQRLQAAKHGMLVEDPVFTPTYDHREAGSGFFSRIFKRRPRPRKAAPTPSRNPNPGGWQAQQESRASEDAELDRLLRKVSEQGIQSLSYVERQQLERITRKRQQEERSIHQ